MSDSIVLKLGPTVDTMRGALRSALRERSPRHLTIDLNTGKQVFLTLDEVLNDTLVGSRRESPDVLCLIPLHAISMMEAK